MIVTGNPRVIRGNPYPYPVKPVPALKGKGFDGSGYGYCIVLKGSRFRQVFFVHTQCKHTHIHTEHTQNFCPHSHFPIHSHIFHPHSYFLYHWLTKLPVHKKVFKFKCSNLFKRYFCRINILLVTKKKNNNIYIYIYIIYQLQGLARGPSAPCS